MNFLADLLTPSPRDEAPVSYAAFGIGHMVLGAAILDHTGASVWIWWVVYVAIKEIAWDIAFRRGSVADSVADAAFVAFGVIVSAPTWWICAAVAAALIRGAWSRSATRRCSRRWTR